MQNAGGNSDRKLVFGLGKQGHCATTGKKGHDLELHKTHPGVTRIRLWPGATCGGQG